MNNMLGFKKFEEFVTNIINGIKSAFNNKKYFLLFTYFIYIFISTTIIFFTTIGAFVGGLKAFGIVRDNIYAPKTQLIYEKVNEKIENDKYITVFKLMFSVPQGQSTGKTLYNYPKGCDSNNLKVLPGGVNFKNGTTYAESTYEITCITKEPLIENYTLFTLKD
jgi:hypothetical protein